MYHHNIEGVIYDKPQPWTQPITNDLYNIIIQEALQLKLIPYLINKNLRIQTRTTTIIFTHNLIRIITYKLKRTTIPYEQYTTLKQLIETHT